MNPMLDGYPEDYNGYLIRTDFRIGIQICQCLADDELSEYERIATALYLLYGKSIPDAETAYHGLAWFLNGGNLPEERNGEEDEKSFDFDVDAGRIITGFRKAYGIDLEKESLHWFKFLRMIGDLGECAFTSVIEYRTKKITSDMPAEMRKTYAELRKRYALKQDYSEEEQSAIADFLAALAD